MIQTVILSLESVLLNTDLVRLVSYRQLFTQCGIPFDGKIYAQYFSGSKFITGLATYLGDIQKSDLFGTVMREKVKCDLQYIDTVSSSQDGLAFLQDIKPTHQLALVSSDDETVVRPILTKLHLSWSFGTVITADSYGKDPPHPAMFDAVHGSISNACDTSLVVTGYPIQIEAAKKSKIVYTIYR
jgi:beta-phosphoglucomutase-like phosphatase (HAD superfamily)